MEHYTGPLDFIGLPGYSIHKDGYVYVDKTGLRKSSDCDGCITVKLKIFGGKKCFSVRKLQWCANNGVHYDKVRGCDITVGSDGEIRTCKDNMEYLRQKKSERRLKPIPIEGRLQRIDEAMQDLQLIREAILSNDYTKVAAKLADKHSPACAGVLSKYYIGARVDLDDIRTEAFDIVMQRIKHGHGVDMAIGLHLYEVLRNLALTMQHQVKKRKKTVSYLLDKLHNPDDELPYQYD